MYENYVTMRDLKGLKDADVARETGLPKSTFSDWKSGRSKPKYEKMCKIASCLGVDVEDIRYAEEIEYDPETHTWDIKRKKSDSQELFDGVHAIAKEIADIAYYGDPKTAEFMEFLHKNPEYSILFDASCKVKPEDISRALKAIGIFIDE